MNLVGKVGRNRPRARFALLMIYCALILGAVTTVYPFLMMVTTGFKSAYDENDNSLVPKYWSDKDDLFLKYVDDKYARNVSMAKSNRIGAKASSDVVAKYETFLMNLPPDRYMAGFFLAANQLSSRLTESYISWLKTKYPTVAELNKAYEEENLYWADIRPPIEQYMRKAWTEPNTRKFREWKEFKTTLPAEYRIPIRNTALWQEFQRAEAKAQFALVAPEVAGTAKTFEELTLPKDPKLLTKFNEKALPPRYAKQSVEEMWAAVAGPGVEMPIDAFERATLTKREADVKSEFASRNYRYALGFILTNGRALVNTAIYCLLAITVALIVNPLAAYALSRYPIRSSGRILLFLLATMAFPAEVAMIPSFLLLKSAGLLNTYWALVLPGAASGYTIYLLKGFFDSLPQELFEAGSLDGAKESTMMLRIALPMSKPVLGYIALITFMAAYGAFIYAFLVVQDQRMWTLTVWLYQLQLTAPKAVVMAGLTLAAVPTLLVFLFAQRVIVRGIVIPNER
ncbi:MAG: carbohydrate ABC transporter permease [Armatimonadetes bacterium]|nr:carbohydrate ABC transporter permease [Armatimonadota bacterium]